METTRTGCVKIPIKIFEDARGGFSELFKLSEYSFLPSFFQDNFALSRENVVRGMHFQRINPQAKFIRVLQGEVTDVIIDLRKDSSTYGVMEEFRLRNIIGIANRKLMACTKRVLIVK